MERVAYHWVSKFKKEGGTGSGMTEGERELDRIKRENERLGTENEFLKKQAPSSPGSRP